MKNYLISILLPVLLLSQDNKEHYLVVGTYTGGKSEGIYLFKFNSQDASFKEISHVATSNPSFLVVSPDQKFIYAVAEDAKNNNGGEIAAFSFNKEKGEINFINKQLSAGDHPCYVDIDKTGKWVFAGNYSSGSLSVLPVNADGSLGEATSIIRHEGTGKDPRRQEKPHVHCTIMSPDNKWLYVPDLGIDKVMIYSFDEKTGKLSAAKQPFAASTAGAGPRHFTFHPNGRFGYLVEELSGHVVAYQMTNGELKFLQRTSTLPRGKAGYAGSADIHVSPDGKFLYASNRGDFNNIAIFKIDANTGKLAIVGFQSTLGKAPRNFNFDPSGNYLLVGNQDSDEIVIFKRNLKSGTLEDTGKRIGIGKPVCLKWAEVK
jgi:6-phosphogluconolactonase